MISHIFFSLAIFFLVLASSFAMYLPLRALTKDRAISLRYAIPFSIAVEIIIGYIFYCTSTTRSFPISYIVFVVLVNLWSYYKLRPITFNKPKISPITIVTLIVLSAAIIYTRYYDGFNFVGPGGKDTYYHLLFIKNLFDLGYLSNGFYAPGFHLFLMPIANIIPLSELYSFTGPAIGIITILSFVLLLKDFLKNKVSLIFLLIALVLPIYNEFTLQTIYFFSSALTFLYFASIILLISDSETNRKKTNYYLLTIFAIALAITVPYFLIALLSASLLLLVIVLFFKKIFSAGYVHYLISVNLIFIFGFIISFGHVYVQSNILKRYNGFPNVAINILKSNNNTPSLVTAGGTTSMGATIEGATSNNELASKLHLPKFLENNPYLKPMIGSAYDMLRIKYIRPANTMLGLGAYLWIVFSFFMATYAIRKKNSAMFTVGVLSIIFGIYTQTGLCEMTNYRGRAGWYLMMLSIFGVILSIDQMRFKNKKMPQYLLSVSLIVLVTGFLFPPQFARSYNNEEYEIVSRVAKQHSTIPITLIANDTQIDIVSNNLTAVGLAPENLKRENSILVLEKNFLTDVNTRIEAEPYFKRYDKFFENENFVIYGNF